MPRSARHDGVPGHFSPPVENEAEKRSTTPSPQKSKKLFTSHYKSVLKLVYI